MTLLRDDDRKQVADIFHKKLKNPVTLHFFTQKASPLNAPVQTCHTCVEAGELLSELTAISEKLKLEVHDLVGDPDTARKFQVDKIPALVFQAGNKGAVRYFGLPSGYEFALLMEDLVDLSQGTTCLSDTTRQRLAALHKAVHIQVLVTPT